MDSEVAEDEIPRQTTSKKKTKRRGRRLTGLSKQRRIANTRERNRVHVINESIDRLRDLIPLLPNEKRPSKTDTIRLAALYISHLTEILAMEDNDHHALVGRESLDEEMSMTSLEFDPFDVETGGRVTIVHFNLFLCCKPENAVILLKLLVSTKNKSFTIATEIAKYCLKRVIYGKNLVDEGNTTPFIIKIYRTLARLLQQFNQSEISFLIWKIIS